MPHLTIILPREDSRELRKIRMGWKIRMGCGRSAGTAESARALRKRRGRIRARESDHSETAGGFVYQDRAYLSHRQVYLGFGYDQGRLEADSPE